MSDDKTLHKVVVLYADVSGSTRLYEQHGDDIARRDIAVCLAQLTEVAESFGGRLLKTIGDEVMCTFPIPQRALEAAKEMHEALRSASAGGRFTTGTLRVKIGWHYGIAEWREKEFVGATPLIAQQVIKMAKAEEILASGAAVEALPGQLREDAQLIDTVESAADGSALTVYKLPWEDSEDATEFRAAPTAAATQSSLVIEYAGTELRVDDNKRHCSIGRIAGNDIVTGSRFTSRHHAEIFYRHGRFHIKDDSINGTVIAPHNGQAVHLHREEGVLEGEGTLIFGNTTTTDAAATARYRCE